MVLARPIKVLQVIGKMHRGGAETLLMHILHHLDRTRIQMDFLVHTAQASDYDDEIQSLGGRIFHCPYTNRPQIYAREFMKVIHDYGPYDVVHSHVHHYCGFVLWLAKLAGVQGRIAHSHSDTTAQQKNCRTVRRIYLKLASSLISSSATSGLAAGSGAARALFGQDWQSDPRWRVYQHGIDPADFEKYVDPISIRHKLNIPIEAFVIGHIGRFQLEKNHAFLVEIAKEIMIRCPDSILLLVGDGDLRSEVEKQVTDAKLDQKVFFAGIREDVPQIMLGAMDVFCLPSIYEGLPVVLLEAQAAGLPCVVSDVISTEVDLVDGMITRISLEENAAEWANTIISQRQSSLPITQKEALTSLKNSPFNIKNSIRELEDIYFATHQD